MDKPERLPLREALQTWCDAALVLQMAEAQSDGIIVHTPKPRNLYGGEGWGFDLETELRLAARLQELNKEQDAIHAKRERADAALLKDFRERIAKGEIILTGLRTKPHLDSDQSIIPAIWAEFLEFELEESRVIAAEVIFIAVTAQPRLAREGSIAGDSQPRPATTEQENDGSQPPRRRGRTNYGPMIKADLRQNWEQVRDFANRSSNKRPNWSHLAKTVRKRLQRMHANHNDQIPHEHTIRTRLPAIYDELLSEDPVQN